MRTNIVGFVSRRTQLRLRSIRREAQFVNKYGQFVPPGPADCARLAQEQREQEREDWEWNRRHGPVPGGGRVVRFPTQARSSSPTAVKTGAGHGRTAPK
jgi:hypothetical protein